MLSEVLYNPNLVKELEPEEIINLFVSATDILRKEPPFLIIEITEGEAIFVGDTHGDFSVTKYITGRFLREKDKFLIFLGDYIDREPEPEGAIYNLIYLCLLKIAYPNRVFLLKGNHEAHYAVYCHPYEFDKALIDTFGSYGVKIHNYAVEVFKEMPLMVKIPCGVIASHAGFPLHGQNIDDKSGKDLILDILWADAEASPMFRGYGIPKFTEKDLANFLNSMDAVVLIRGHDPYLAGKIIYSGKLITIFTSRTYAYRAGMKIARATLEKRISDANKIILEDLTSFLNAFE